MTKTPSPVEALKPCPFCGGAAIAWPVNGGLVDVGCEAWAHACPVQPCVRGRSETTAIAAWNTRANNTQGSGEGEAVAWLIEETWSGYVHYIHRDCDPEAYRRKQRLITKEISAAMTFDTKDRALAWLAQQPLWMRRGDQYQVREHMWAAPHIEAQGSEPSAKHTMTLNLTNEEMAALEKLAAEQDLKPPTIFRQALRVYQLYSLPEGHPERIGRSPTYGADRLAPTPQVGWPDREAVMDVLTQRFGHHTRRAAGLAADAIIALPSSPWRPTRSQLIDTMQAHLEIVDVLGEQEILGWVDASDAILALPSPPSSIGGEG